MPITPSEAMQAKRLLIPPEVFEAFDSLIVKHIDISGTAVVTQSEAIDLVCNLLKIPRGASARELNDDEAMTEIDVFNNGWMDVEESYRAAGWTVGYDRPTHYESGEPTYTFSYNNKGM